MFRMFIRNKAAKVWPKMRSIPSISISWKYQVLYVHVFISLVLLAWPLVSFCIGRISVVFSAGSKVRWWVISDLLVFLGLLGYLVGRLLKSVKQALPPTTVDWGSEIGALWDSRANWIYLLLMLQASCWPMYTLSYLHPVLVLDNLPHLLLNLVWL